MIYKNHHAYKDKYANIQDFITFAGHQAEDIMEPKHTPAAHLIGIQRLLMYLVEPSI